MQAFTDAIAAHKANNLGAAELLYRQVIGEDPEHFEAANNLGTIAIQRRRHDEAIHYYQEALAVKPDYGIAYSNMAAALVNMGYYAAALPYCKCAYELIPDNVPALVNLSDALVALARFEEAAAVATHALTLHPAFPDALVNLGIASWGLGDRTKAKQLLSQAANQDPALFAARGIDLARKNLGILALAEYDFDNGWTNYEARFDIDKIPRRYNAYPQWDGSANGNGRLVVVAEQGLGDELLYLTMLKDVADRFQGEVIWEMDTRLIPFVRTFLTLPGNVVPMQRRLMHVAKFDDGADKATYRIDIASLGKFFRRQLSDFPKPVEPLYQTISMGPKRIGVSWRSVNMMGGIDKSIPLSEFIGLLDQPNEYVSLQYGATPELSGHYASIEKPKFDARYDIVALAYLIQSCEHVVTVSNTTAHLAGILGVPTTVLLNKNMGRYWYWGNDYTTPWYPKTRIVRRNDRPWAEILSKLTI